MIGLDLKALKDVSSGLAANGGSVTFQLGVSSIDAARVVAPNAGVNTDGNGVVDLIPPDGTLSDYSGADGETTGNGEATANRESTTGLDLPLPPHGLLPPLPGARRRP